MKNIVISKLSLRFPLHQASDIQIPREFVNQANLIAAITAEYWKVLE